MRLDEYRIAQRRRLGFVWEGRLRQRLVRKGRNRDSDMLSIIDGEWPQRDAELRARLAAANFDEEGRQQSGLRRFGYKFYVGYSPTTRLIRGNSDFNQVGFSGLQAARYRFGDIRCLGHPAAVDAHGGGQRLKIDMRVHEVHPDKTAQPR